LKAATRGRDVVWHCSECDTKVRCMFPPDKYWYKDHLDQILRGKHGRYYRRIRRLAAAHSEARRAKIRLERNEKAD
jgi:hypothetical protein